MKAGFFTPSLRVKISTGAELEREDETFVKQLGLEKSDSPPELWVERIRSDPTKGLSLRGFKEI